MPYSITTKDGITINNIPDDVQPDSADLKARVAQIRSSTPEQAPAQEVQEPSMMQDIAAGAARGLAPIAGGAALGAAMGAPLAGVGAIPGAIAGAGAGALAQMVGDPVINAVNKLTGSTFATPTEAIEGLLTAAGMPKVQTEAGRIAQTTAAGAGLGGGFAAAGKTLQAAAASPLGKAVGGAIAAQPVAQVTGGAGAGLAGQMAQESGAGTGGQIAASLLGGVAGGALPFAKQIGKAAQTATQATAQSAAKALAPPQAGISTSRALVPVKESLQSIGATIKGKISPEKQQAIKQQLLTQPDSVETVGFKLSGSQVVPDNLANETIKQGWKDGTIASIKAASDADKTKMQQMLNIFKMGEKSEKFRAMNRPADILGKSVDSRVQFLVNTKNQAGKEIDQIAQTQLKGQPINYDPAINSFIDDLNQLGVQVVMDDKGVAKAVLTGSDIQGDKAAQRILNATLERLSTTKAPDAYGLHTAKRFIDTQVSYGKKSLASPLTTQAERTLKNLRKNLNQTLGDQFENYRVANTKYADSITALDDMQKAAGTKLDFDSPNADKAFGTAMRKLLSNYGSRANMIDALDEVNKISAKYGMKIDDDVINQVIFVNELDRMFGAAADMTFKGQIAQGIRTGADIASGGAKQRALELLAEGAERLRGVNKENAIKAMEELLKSKQSRI